MHLQTESMHYPHTAGLASQPIRLVMRLPMTGQECEPLTPLHLVAHNEACLATQLQHRGIRRLGQSLPPIRRGYGSSAKHAELQRVSAIGNRYGIERHSLWHGGRARVQVQPFPARRLYEVFGWQSGLRVVATTHLPA